MTSMIFRVTKRTHKNFIHTCWEKNVRVQALYSIDDKFFFRLEDTQETLIDLARSTRTILYPEKWMKDRYMARQRNFANIYGEV